MVDPAQTESPVLCNSNGPAVVKWINDGKTHCLGLHPSSKVQFHLYYDAASKTAFFKLRIPVTLESLFDIRTPLFIFVHPERIESLSRIENVIPQDLSDYLLKSRHPNGTPLHLRFTLSRPADLVLPKTIARKAFHDAVVHAQAVLGKGTEQPTADGNEASKVTYLWTMLARASTFDVYTHLLSAKGDSTVNAIPAICEAASSHVLNSHVASSDLVSLYGGKGAQVLDLSDVTFDVPSCGESPPAYHEAAPTVPADAKAGDIGKCGPG